MTTAELTAVPPATRTEPASPARCPYCGNNPVPHFLHWYFESINVLFGPLRVLLLYNPLALLVKRAFGRIPWALGLTDLLAALGVVGFSDDVASCPSGRGQVLWEEAIRRGVTVRELKLFGRRFDTYVAERGPKRIVFSGLPRPRGYDDRNLDILDDKPAFKRVMSAAGLPVAAGGVAKSFRQAERIFERVAKPVIVKPRSGSRGRHTSTYVYTKEQLKEAFAVAKQLCYWVVVEEHLEGPVYRGTVIDYRCRGVLRGDSPQVVGDGARTVAELAAARNAAPHEGSADIVLDGRTDRFLARRGLTRFSVPPAGQVVYLSEKVGVSYGGSSSEDFEACHPKNKSLFERAARACGDPILGFDFIIPDITKSWREQRCGFIEVNTLPFINLHHHPLLGRPQNVAARVWDLVGF